MPLLVRCYNNQSYCQMFLAHKLVYFKTLFVNNYFPYMSYLNPKHHYLLYILIVRARGSAMVFNATFNIILVISWRSVLLLEETGVPEENHRPVGSHCQTLSHNVVSSRPHLSGIRTHNVSDDRH